MNQSVISDSQGPRLIFSKIKGEAGFTPGDSLTGARQPGPGEKTPGFFS